MPVATTVLGKKKNTADLANFLDASNHKTTPWIYYYDYVIFLLLVNTAIPRFTRQPLHRFNIDPGSTISLSIVAVNGGIYQWQVNDTDADESSKYQGTTTSTLVIHNIEENDEGFYLCIVSNEYISVRSDRAAITVCKSILSKSLYWVSRTQYL